MPEWWLGLLLIATFGVGFWFFPGIFPTGGLHSPDVDPNSLKGVLDTMWHLVLPVIDADARLPGGLLADHAQLAARRAR